MSHFSRGDGLTIASALTKVARAAETSRTTLGHVTLHADAAALEDAAARLSVTASQLEHLRRDIGSSELRYQAIRPSSLPVVADHIPEFLRTKKDVDTEESDRAAEKRGAALALHCDVSEYNMACDTVLARFERSSTAALGVMDASVAAAISASDAKIQQIASSFAIPARRGRT